MKFVPAVLLLLVFVCGCRDYRKVTSWHDTGRKIMAGREWGYMRRNGDGVTEWIKDGPFEQYRTDGSVSARGFYKNNLPFGKLELYYPDGVLRLRQNFDSGGMLHGKQFCYRTDGTLLKEYSFRHGTGTEYWFYDSGELKRELQWVKGELHGVVKEYDSDGNLTRTVNYVQGEKQ